MPLSLQVGMNCSVEFTSQQIYNHACSQDYLFIIAHIATGQGPDVVVCLMSQLCHAGASWSAPLWYSGLKETKCFFSAHS